MERPSPARDRHFMKNALNISLRGIGNTWPNPSVGVVVVKNDQIISRGWTQPGGKPHAEIVALKKKNFFWSNFIYNFRTLFTPWKNTTLYRSNYKIKNK